MVSILNRFKNLSIFVFLIILNLPVAASAEIYRWVDAQGKTHFAQDLHGVPKQYRRQAEENSSSRPQDDGPEGGSLIQTYEATEVTPHQWKQVETPVYRKGRFEVPLQAAPGGQAFFVQVRLNEELTVPFLLDTGATHVVLTRAVADRLGVEVGPNTKWSHFRTANGVVKHPVVRLESVETNGAFVSDVQAAISDSMEVGLLGTSFLNQFEYSIDPVAGVMRLRDRVSGQ